MSTTGIDRPGDHRLKPVDAKLVQVTWRDSSGSGTWRPERSLTTAECQTVGWLTQEDHVQITVSASRNSEDEWADQTAIPAGCVLAIDELEIGRRR